MEITYQNSSDDIAAILRNRSLWEHLCTIYELSYVVVIWSPALVFNVLLQNWMFVVILLIAMLGFWVYSQYQYAKLILFPGNSAKVFPGDQTVKLKPTHLEMRGERGVSRRCWSGIPRIINAANHLLFYVSTNRAFIIPKQAFESSDHAQQYFDLAQSYWKNSPEPDPLSHDWPTFLDEFGIDCGPLWQQKSWQFHPQLNARVIATGPDPTNIPTLPKARGLLILFLVGIFLAGIAWIIKLWAIDNYDEMWLISVLMNAIVTIYLMVVGVSLNMPFVYFNELQRQKGLGDKKVEAWIYQNGIGLRTDLGVSFAHWKIIEEVAPDYESIVIYDLKPVVHVVLPKTAFENDEPFQAATHQIVELCNHAKSDDDLVQAEISDNPFQSPREA